MFEALFFFFFLLVFLVFEKSPKDKNIKPKHTDVSWQHT